MHISLKYSVFLIKFAHSKATYSFYGRQPYDRKERNKLSVPSTLLSNMRSKRAISVVMGRNLLYSITKSTLY